MPYEKQPSSCLAHMGFLMEKVDSTIKYAKNFDYATNPDTDTVQKLVETYNVIETGKSDPWCPLATIAIDGSRYSKPTEHLMPSTQIGYVKIGMVTIYREDIENINKGGPYVDPTLIADIHNKVKNYHYVLPGSNVRYNPEKSVKDGFRQLVHDLFQEPIDFSELINSAEEIPELAGKPVIKFSLFNTLLAVMAGRAGRLGTGGVDTQRCVCCGFRDRNPDDRTFVFTKANTVVKCPDCGGENYLTDTLNIHDSISEANDATNAINRFMITVEHILMMTRIIAIAEYRPDLIGDMAFIIDGPLAIFGPKTRLGEAMMKAYYEIFDDLKKKEYDVPLLIGLQKQGALADHANLIEPHIPVGAYRFIDDAYRNKYVAPVDASDYGKETYYGQDILMKPSHNRIMCVSLLYPFRVKSNDPDEEPFRDRKVDPQYYGDSLERIMDLLISLQFDMYPNGIMPIEIAHTNVAISMKPSGMILDMITDYLLNRKTEHKSGENIAESIVKAYSFDL